MSVEIDAVDKKIFDAAIKMIATEGYGALKVRPLCSYANVHHSTFYNHFDDINVMLEKLEDYYFALISDVLDFPNDTTFTYEKALKFTHFIKEAPEYYTVLNRRERFIMKMIHQFEGGFDINNYRNKSTSDADYLNSFMLTGGISMLEFWAHKGCVESPEKMAQLIYDCLVILSTYDMNNTKLNKTVTFWQPSCFILLHNDLDRVCLTPQ